MPYVRGFLRLARRPGRPDLPPGEDILDPDYGLEEGEPPQVEPPDEPPPGIWPGPTPGHPIVPVPPAGENPGHPDIPPGAILAEAAGAGWRQIHRPGARARTRLALYLRRSGRLAGAACRGN